MSIRYDLLGTLPLPLRELIGSYHPVLETERWDHYVHFTNPGLERLDAHPWKLLSELFEEEDLWDILEEGRSWETRWFTVYQESTSISWYNVVWNDAHTVGHRQYERRSLSGMPGKLVLHSTFIWQLRLMSYSIELTIHESPAIDDARRAIYEGPQARGMIWGWRCEYHETKTAGGAILRAWRQYKRRQHAASIIQIFCREMIHARILEEREEEQQRWALKEDEGSSDSSKLFSDDEDD